MAKEKEEELETPTPADDAAPEAEPTGEQRTADDLEVDLSEKIDFGDGKTEPAAEKADKGEKKKNKYKELKRQNEEYGRQLAELRGQLQTFALQPRQTTERQQPPEDPAERELEGLEDQRQGILTQLSAKDVSKEDGERLLKQYRKVERQIRDKDVEIAIRKRGLQPPQQQDPQAIERQMLAAEFPDVFGNDVMRMRAQAEMAHLMQNLRKPYSIATAREAAQRVRQQFGAARPSPGAGEADKLRGVSGRAGDGGGGGQSFKPTRLQLNAARAYTAHMPDMSDADRVKKWVKDVAKPAGLVS